MDDKVTERQARITANVLTALTLIVPMAIIAITATSCFVGGHFPSWGASNKRKMFGEGVVAYLLPKLPT